MSVLGPLGCALTDLWASNGKRSSETAVARPRPMPSIRHAAAIAAAESNRADHDSLSWSSRLHTLAAQLHHAFTSWMTGGLSRSWCRLRESAYWIPRLRNRYSAFAQLGLRS